MSDAYLVVDKGYQVIDMKTGELFADVGPTTWVNVGQAGVVAMERIWADGGNKLVDLGEAQVAAKEGNRPAKK